jgi:undecaprenyl-diphosphatase
VYSARTFARVIILRYMNDFDTTILLFLNKFSGQSWVFDHFAHDIQRQTLTGGVIMALFWGAWFWQGADKARIREHLTATCIGSFVALFVARILAVVLPFRERPLWNPELAFQPPYGSEQETPLSTWSSFPSDHAVLFFRSAAFPEFTLGCTTLLTSSLVLS